MKKLTTAALFAMLPAAACLAGDESWTGEIEFGFNRATGNTESDSLLGRVKLGKKISDWRNEIKLETIRSTENDNRIKQNYIIGLQTNRDFNDRHYAFGNVNYINDKFGGFRSQASLSSGWGWHAIKNDKTVLDTELGIGYRRSEEQNTGVNLSEAIFVGAAKWSHQWTETTQLINNFRVESGSDNTYFDNELAARVKINSSLGLKVSYIVRHNTDVPVGTKNTDTLTAVSLDYKF